MKRLREGQYFGNSNFKVSFDGISITDTEYTHDYVDWHGHENPYFTFLLQGKLIEENKKETYCLSQGSLLFHNWQDFHRNIKPPEFTRGAHLEINTEWAKHLDIDLTAIEGSIKVKDPRIKNLLFNVLIESKKADAYNRSSIQLLVIEIVTALNRDVERRRNAPPKWLNKLEELIYEHPNDKITLAQISKALTIHPVHLSRTFHKYYGTTFGQYCREIRLHRAISSILSKKHTMADVVYLNNYYDQSHMIAAFKKKFKVTPKQLARILG